MTLRSDPFTILCIVLAVVFPLMVLASCSPTIKYVCPQLAPPTLKVVDALEATGKTDPSSAVWVTQLDKHYEKLDECKPK